MRRFLSITLLLVFFLPLFAPLMALDAPPESRLPMCCRHGGEHRCMQAMAVEGAPQWRAPNRCPMYPTTVAPAHSQRMGVLAAALIFGEVVVHPGVRR